MNQRVPSQPQHYQTVGLGQFVSPVKSCGDQQRSHQLQNSYGQTADDSRRGTRLKLHGCNLSLLRDKTYYYY